MTTADRLKTEIAQEKAKLAQNDKHIEDGERRQSLRRQYGDRIFNRLVLLETQLEREEALLIKPEGRASNWRVN
jgi:hypothetical protein